MSWFCGCAAPLGHTLSSLLREPRDRLELPSRSSMLGGTAVPGERPSPTQDPFPLPSFLQKTNLFVKRMYPAKALCHSAPPLLTPTQGGQMARKYKSPWVGLVGRDRKAADFPERFSSSYLECKGDTWSASSHPVVLRQT